MKDYFEQTGALWVVIACLLLYALISRDDVWDWLMRILGG